MYIGIHVINPRFRDLVSRVIPSDDRSRGSPPAWPQPGLKADGENTFQGGIRWEVLNTEQKII